MIPPNQFGDTTYTKVFVGGLPWETKKDTMMKYFDQFGHILEAVVITDKNTGRSKGYGFVTFSDPEAATRACADPAPVIDGRRANCNLASFGVPKSAPTTPQNGSNRSIRIMKSFNNGGAAFPNPAVAAGLPLYSAPAVQPVGIPPYNVYGYPPYSAEYAYPMQNYYNVYGGLAPAQYPQIYGAAGATAGALYPFYQIGQHGTTGAAVGTYGHSSNGYASSFQGYNTVQYPQMFQYTPLASPAVVTGFGQQYYGGGSVPLASTTAAQPVCFAVKQA